MLRLAPLVLLLSYAPSLAEFQPVSPADSVSCSLSEYQTLYRQAYLEELKHSGEKERREARQDIERQRTELQAKQAALGDASTMRVQRAKVLPGNWQLVNHTAVGSYHLDSEPEERSMATYAFTLDFTIFESEWTAIPIIDSQTIVADWVVTRAVADGSVWKEVELGQNTLLVLKPREAAEGEQQWKDHTLVTNSSGRYRIHFRIFTHVRSNRNLFTLSLNLLYPLAHTQLRLHHESTSGHIKELSVEPAAFYDITKGSNFSDVHIRLPSSTVAEVKWRMQAGAQKAKSKTSASSLGGAEEAEDTMEQTEEDQAAQAIVLHDSLHAVADGILQSSHTFKYQLDSAAQSLSSVDIVVLSPARVSSVIAHGMQTWKTSNAKSLSLPGQLGDAAASTGNVSGTVITVVFKSSVISKEVIIKVSTEQEYDVEAGLVALPVAICQGVLRQTGTLAVVKVANVEVYEQSAAGVVRIGSDEVPSHVRGGTALPIVLAYKYLSPRNSVTISVIHHEELRTLEAVADTALHQVLIVDTQIMHTFHVVVQNMHRQYMEIQGIPAAATLWSLKVNSIDTKPVRGRQGSLMVPLLVGPQGHAEGGTVPKTSIELAWLATGEALGENGTLDLNPPRIDMPISALSVEVQFPSDYVVNFTGTLMEVDKFSQKQPKVINYETGSDVTQNEFDFNSMPKEGRGSSGSKVGLKAKVSKTGKRYMFEKLLVVNDSATLTAVYHRAAEQVPETYLSQLSARISGILQ